MSAPRPQDHRQSQFTRTNARVKRLRTEMSATERHFWGLVRKMEGVKGRFRRQAPIGPYVVDFAHHGAKLVIELDGPFHDGDDARVRDARRDAWLTQNGFRVLRFSNDEVWKETPRVFDVIRAALVADAPSPQPLSHEGRGATEGPLDG